MKYADASSMLLLAVLGGTVSLTGCSHGASQADLDRARAAGASEQAQRATEASLSADVKRLKDEAARGKAAASRSTASAKPAAPAPAVPPAASVTACGGNVSVGANTSCAFGGNVASSYYAYGAGGVARLDVYSPVTGTYYMMTCVPGIPVVCTGGNNATVYIR